MNAVQDQRTTAGWYTGPFQQNGTVRDRIYLQAPAGSPDFSCSNSLGVKDRESRAVHYFSQASLTHKNGLK